MLMQDFNIQDYWYFREGFEMTVSLMTWILTPRVADIEMMYSFVRKQDETWGASDMCGKT